MWAALTVVASVIAGLALLAYAGFLAARYFFVPRYPDEIHFGATDDGWRIALIRYRPARPAAALDGPNATATDEPTAPGREPVLLVHGFAANRYNFDLSDDRSLARDLAAHGFDAWVVELRGRGYSERPRLFSGLKYEWCFDEYAERDLPAAAATILRATGARRLHLVGFSTGALACLAFLADTRRTVEVASFTGLAAATAFKRAGAHISGRLVRNLRWLRHRFLMRVLAPLSGYWRPSGERIMHNPQNLDGETLRRTMVNLSANFARNELLQYGDWLMNDQFRSIDQRRDYRAELARVEVPALLVAGARDPLAPADAVKVTHDALASATKRFVIASRAQKFSANYGHFDLLLGPEAPREIYPLVRAWLEEQGAQPVAGAPAPEPPVIEPPVAPTA